MTMEHGDIDLAPAPGNAPEMQPQAERPVRAPQKRKRRLHPFWAKQLHLWHWMSSAICLVGMILFAFTGITLNHSGQIEGDPRITTVERDLPEPIAMVLTAPPPFKDAPVPEIAADWARTNLTANIAGRAAEWNEGEVYVPLPQPGGDGWVAFDLNAGTAQYEHTDRGWISWLNDLHKGRDTGTAWIWFLDIFAGACIIFSLTGFLLLQLHARHRPSTWPLVGAGVILPLLVIIIFVHS